MEICSFGCGQEGKYQLKNGKWVCSDSLNKCPERRRVNSSTKRTIRYRECKYCKKQLAFHGNLHEETCYLNPENLKLCPRCGNPIKDYKHAKTCSCQCANSLFKHIGPDHWNFKGDECSDYRSICFKYHGSKCLICGEKNTVHAHHIDEDRSNHKLENLVPLCLNHHHYMHSEFKVLIEEKILSYIEEFKMKNRAGSLIGKISALHAEVEGSNPSLVHQR